MRSLLTVLLVCVVTLGMVSCTYDDPVGAPIQTQNSISNYQPFQLPANNGLNKQITVTGTVTAAAGGSIVFEHSNGAFSLKMTLTFGPGAVSQDMTLQMTSDEDILAATFGPDGTQFLVPGDLTIEAHGLNLASVPNPETLSQRIRLLYLNEETGAWEPIEAGSYSADVRTGTVTCSKGTIRHFSRYGFGV